MMYQFRITKQEKGYRFELKGIKLLIDDFIIKNDRHFLTNPNKAIAYFNTGNSVYGVLNEPFNYATAEEFHDAMELQYQILYGEVAG